MYLRTSRRKNKDGSVTEYYQLAHNERHPETRKPVARIVHNFGKCLFCPNSQAELSAQFSGIGYR
jgi:hypothetical protein